MLIFVSASPGGLCESEGVKILILSDKRQSLWAIVWAGIKFRGRQLKWTYQRRRFVEGNLFSLNG